MFILLNKIISIILKIKIKTLMMYEVDKFSFMYHKLYLTLTVPQLFYNLLDELDTFTIHIEIVYFQNYRFLFLHNNK